MNLTTPVWALGAVLLAFALAVVAALVIGFAIS